MQTKSLRGLSNVAEMKKNDDSNKAVSNLYKPLMLNSQIKADIDSEIYKVHSQTQLRKLATATDDKRKIDSIDLNSEEGSSGAVQEKQNTCMGSCFMVVSVLWVGWSTLGLKRSECV